MFLCDRILNEAIKFRKKTKSIYIHSDIKYEKIPTHQKDLKLSNKNYTFFINAKGKTKIPSIL